MRKILLASALSLGLFACTNSGEPPATPTSSPITNPVTAVCSLTANSVRDEQALYAAETAYNIPAHSYVTLDAAGKLSPSLKAAVKPKLQSAYLYLLAARSAYKAGDTCDFYAATEAAKIVANEVRSLLPNSS